MKDETIAYRIINRIRHKKELGKRDFLEYSGKKKERKNREIERGYNCSTNAFLIAVTE